MAGTDRYPQSLSMLTLYTESTHAIYSHQKSYDDVL